MRQRLCRICGDFHELEAWPSRCFPVEFRKRSKLPAPGFIVDTMQPVQSMLDGRMYDSKSALRQTYRQAGVQELGNDSSIVDPKPRKKPRANEKAIRDSIDKAFSRAGLGA